MLTCRLIKPRSPRGLGRAWHGLGSEAPSELPCNGEKDGSHDQGAEQNAQGSGIELRSMAERSRRRLALKTAPLASMALVSCCL